MCLKHNCGQFNGSGSTNASGNYSKFHHLMSGRNHYFNFFLCFRKYLVNNFYYGSANQDVMKNITDPTLRSAFSLDDPSILDKTNFTPNLTADQRTAWTAMWDEVKSSQ